MEDAPLFANNHTATVDSVEWLLQAAPLLTEDPLKVHVAVDSGMGQYWRRERKELTEVEAVYETVHSSSKNVYPFCNSG